MSKAEFIAFLDCDDLWKAEFLEELLSSIGEAPAAHCVTQGIGPDGSPIGHLAEMSRQRRRSANSSHMIITPIDEPTTFENLITCCCIFSPGAGIVRRDCFEEVGGFDPRILYCEDWDFWIKLARLGPLKFVDSPFFFYRSHDSNRYAHNWKIRRDVAYVRLYAIGHSR